MDRAWKQSEGEIFEERALRAITAGREEAGGDAGGHRSAALITYETEPWGRTDLRIDFAPKRVGVPDAVDMLREAWDRYRPLIPFYKVRPHNPQMGGWLDWLKGEWAGVRRLRTPRIGLRAAFVAAAAWLVAPAFAAGQSEWDRYVPGHLQVLVSGRT
jgi:hypothetical protein